MAIDERVLVALHAGEQVPAVLRQLRNYWGTNDAVLSRLTGIKRTTLANKMKGNGAFSPGEMRALAAVFGVPIEVLYLKPGDAVRWILDHPEAQERAVINSGFLLRWARVCMSA
jgi:transcriptional regulator with XRE-family HTH domain